MRTPKRRNSLIGAREGLPFEISLESTSRIARYERRLDKEKLRQFNSEVKEWMGYMIQDLKGRIYKSKGETERVGFSFAREGIYIHRGAGRGQGGFRGGSKWTDKYGKLKKTNPDSFYLMGTGNRHPIRWFDPIIEKNLPKLADIVADYAADMQIDASRIFIDKD